MARFNRRQANAALGAVEQMLEHDEHWPDGVSDTDMKEAQDVLKAICAALAPKCPGRHHPRHVSDVCAGSCCTTCGGPIDDSSECRCDSSKAGR